ncbi:uncharacterized protein BJ212DRAFT_1299969 [Suillus subaureus]|uniref:Uncharacterized protein n=1 Tax=Suillus subaureus TaxID=48587 RepID=A0A9P7EB52_9AGAM|nr:uncharacterized protein BJ212DRAFT_1299969 [Suillus subaureus]KAG1816152.1 hypothetical protein BJ212DRAFT_1299969 [Suillus subaureus]
MYDEEFKAMSAELAWESKNHVATVVGARRPITEKQHYTNPQFEILDAFRPVFGRRATCDACKEIIRPSTPKRYQLGQYDDHNKRNQLNLSRSSVEFVVVGQRAEKRSEDRRPRCHLGFTEVQLGQHEDCHEKSWLVLVISGVYDSVGGQRAEKKGEDRRLRCNLGFDEVQSLPSHPSESLL